MVNVIEGQNDMLRLKALETDQTRRDEKVQQCLAQVNEVAKALRSVSISQPEAAAQFLDLHPRRDASGVILKDDAGRPIGYSRFLVFKINDTGFQTAINVWAHNHIKACNALR